MLIICKRKSHTTHHTCPSFSPLPFCCLSLPLFLSCVFRYPDSPFGWLPRSKFTDLLTMNWQKPKSQTTTVERGAAVERNRERGRKRERDGNKGSVRYWASVKKWRWYHDTDREVRKLHTIIKWAAARAVQAVATVQLATLPQLLAQPSLALIAISALRLRQI